MTPPTQSQYQDMLFEIFPNHMGKPQEINLALRAIEIAWQKSQSEVLKQKHTEFVRKIKEEPEDKVNSAQEFLIDNGFNDLVLNDSQKNDVWKWASDVMINFLRWKVDQTEQEVFG